MPNYSPGPYSIIRSSKPKHRAARFIQNDDGLYVGKVYGHENQPVEANALLFAAAPDLLEACLSILRSPSIGSDSPGSVNICVQSFNLKALRAAVEKATKTQSPSPSVRHANSWSGSIPCTGVYRCLKCGKVWPDAHALDYSSVNHEEECPGYPSPPSQGTP